jgi:hypothetical protein
VKEIVTIYFSLFVISYNYKKRKEERHKLFFKTFLPQLEEIKLLIVALEFLFRQNAREIFNINDKVCLLLLLLLLLFYSLLII